jgi:hypothetical protein
VKIPEAVHKLAEALLEEANAPGATPDFKLDVFKTVAPYYTAKQSRNASKDDDGTDTFGALKHTLVSKGGHA